MAKIHLIGTALVAAALVAGCNKNPSPEADGASVPAADPNEAMLVVNGQKLTRGQIDADVAAIVAAQGDKIPAAQLEFAKRSIADRIARSFLFENVLAAKAEKLGYAITDEDFKAKEADYLKSVAGLPDAPKTLDEAFEKHPLGKERSLAEFRTTILIDKMIKAEVVDKNAKDYTAEAKAFVANIESNNAATAVSDAEALKKIKGIRSQLDGLADDKLAEKFAELAKSSSDCPSGARGGDLDFFAKGAMVPEFEKAAFGLDVGKLSDVVKTSFGYHLIMVTDKKDAVEAKGETSAEPAKVRASHILCKVQKSQTVPTLEEVVNYLKQRDERENVNNFVNATVREADVQTSDDYKRLLPPPEEIPVETPNAK